ncbi:MAG TPA: NUDIX domain-containing protein [Polyangia bacterium]|jgi:isopentenyldiphosphate isomerase
MSDERFPVVDETGRVIGAALRREVHGDPRLIHPVVHCIVTDRAGRWLLQLRCRDKDVQPGKWDTSVGGHVSFGEAIEAALARELLEEIGVRAADVSPRFLYRYLMRNAIESELVHTYTCVTEGPFTRQVEEIDELRFWAADAITAALGTGVFTPNFEEEYGRYRAAAGP